MKKQPEITEKTRQAFVNAFWELAKEKPIPKIAVSELTRRAGYNRSTFYEYFLDTDDLLEYIEKNLLEEVQQNILLGLPENITLESFIHSDLLRNIFTAVNEKVYLLLGANGDPCFFAKIKTQLLPIAAGRFSIPTDVPNFDYLTSFVNSAVLGLLQHWNEQGKNLGTEEILTMMCTLLLHGLSAFIGDTNT